ncbi:MAG TPA: hypothetical protein VGK52_19465, partial [Polyangia bacterium]
MSTAAQMPVATQAAPPSGTGAGAAPQVDAPHGWHAPHESVPVQAPPVHSPFVHASPGRHDGAPASGEPQKRAGGCV